MTPAPIRRQHSERIMSKHRQEKVSHEILRLLSSAFLEDVKDPRVADITLTDVRVSSDLSVASVRYLCPKTSDRAEIEAGLIKVMPYLRSLIGERLSLRRVPSLNFYYDEAYEKGAQMSDLLARLRAEGQMGSDGEEG